MERSAPGPLEALPPKVYVQLDLAKTKMVYILFSNSGNEKVTWIEQKPKRG